MKYNRGNYMSRQMRMHDTGRVRQDINCTIKYLAALQEVCYVALYGDPACDAKYPGRYD